MPPWLEIFGDADLASVLLKTIGLKDCVQLAKTCCTVYDVVSPRFWDTANAMKKYGRAKALTWAAINNKLNVILDAHQELGCPLTQAVTDFAATFNRVGILEYVHKFEPCMVAKALPTAAKYGSMQCLQYSLGAYTTHDTQEHVRAASNAVEFGRVDCLALLYEYMGTPCASVVSAAARRGKRSCLEYMNSIDCVKDETAIKSVASRNEAETLRFLDTNGWPWPPIETVLRLAAIFGSRAVLEYCIEKGCPMTKEVVISVIHCAQGKELSTSGLSCNRYDLVTWLVEEHGCPVDEATVKMACAEGCLCILKFLLERGCPYYLQGLKEINKERFEEEEQQSMSSGMKDLVKCTKTAVAFVGAFDRWERAVAPVRAAIGRHQRAA